MHKDSETVDRDQETFAPRKPYSPPVLQQFGPVGALTQAGTVSTTEPNMMGLGMNRV